MADFILEAAMQIQMGNAVDNLMKLGNQAKQNGSALSQMGQKAGIAMNKLTVAFAVLGNAATSVFGKMMEASPSLQVAMLQIDLAMESVYRTLGEALAPLIEEVVLPLVQQFVEWFMNLDEQTQRNIAIFIGLVVVLATVIPVVLAIISGISGLWTILTILGTVIFSYVIPAISAFLVAIGPIGWVILAIIAIVALFALAYKTNFLGIRDITDEVVGQIVGYISGLVDYFTEAFSEGGITGVLLAFVVTMIEIRQAIFNIIINMITFLTEKFDDFFGTNITQYVEDFADFVNGMFDAISGFIDSLIGMDLGEIIDTVFGAIEFGFNALITTVGNILIDALNWVIDKINIPINALDNWSLTPQWIKDAISPIEKIDRLHTGGSVNGVGEKQITAIGGEYMLNAAEVRRAGGPAGVRNMMSGGGGGKNVINNTFNLYPRSRTDRRQMEEIYDFVSSKLEKQAQRRGKF